MDKIEFNKMIYSDTKNVSTLPDEWAGTSIIRKSTVSEEDWVAFTQEVENFQRLFGGLEIDGKLGEKTLKALFRSFKIRKMRVGSVIFDKPDVLFSSPEYRIKRRGTIHENRIISLWNNYGGHIQTMAKAYSIPIESALAVFAVESGRAYDEETNLVIIRFETHVFKSQSGGRVMKNLGRSQHSEWETLVRAAEMDEEAAFKSVSWGLPQLMGFNYQVTNFDSPQEMALVFQKSCEIQIEGFFQFLDKNNLVRYIRVNDWRTFVRYYNGPGQISHYSGILVNYVNLINRMKNYDPDFRDAVNN